MKKSKFTESQILESLQEAESEVPVAELCRKRGISVATFYQVGPAKSNPVRFQPNPRPVSAHWTGLCQQTAIAQAPESGPQKGSSGPDAVPHASASAGCSPQRTAPYAAHHLQRL